jgi:toxin ParE1/3/4
MKRRFVVGREAEQDVAEAVDWLQDRSPSLPARFRTSLEATFASIADAPEMYPLVHREVHRALLRHFPYSVFYVVTTDSIVVLGVVHQARHSRVWRRRL